MTAQHKVFVGDWPTGTGLVLREHAGFVSCFRRPWRWLSSSGRVKTEVCTPYLIMKVVWSDCSHSSRVQTPTH